MRENRKKNPRNERLGGDRRGVHTIGHVVIFLKNQFCIFYGYNVGLNFLFIRGLNAVSDGEGGAGLGK